MTAIRRAVSLAARWVWSNTRSARWAVLVLAATTAGLLLYTLDITGWLATATAWLGDDASRWAGVAGLTALVAAGVVGAVLLPRRRRR